jgi:RNA-directed DNA polymerase
VRGVQITKPDGGQRQLGIPTVVDHLVQQAIAQVLARLIDPNFSAHSYGFRPGRSAHQAVRQGAAYVAEGRGIVVDLDLEKFFDRVNHDILMARLARHVSDKRLLRIVRRFLEAGLMQDGVCARRDEGTPQGGPLSPLLANLLLDDLDKELERRGHRFCRNADDGNIYVQSPAAGVRVLASVTTFLEGTLKLRVNSAKSAVAPAGEHKFLGYRLLAGGRLGLAPSSADRCKDRLRRLTRRNRGKALEEVVGEINRFTAGWLGYFRYAECRSWLRDVDGWLRQKLRCYRLKQAKRAKGIADFLRSCGIPERTAWATAACSRGWWGKALTPGAKHAMDQAWFDRLGLIPLTQRHMALNQP